MKQLRFCLIFFTENISSKVDMNLVEHQSD